MRYVVQITRLPNLPFKRCYEATTSIEALRMGLNDPEVAKVLQGFAGNLWVSALLPAGAKDPSQRAKGGLKLKAA